VKILGLFKCDWIHENRTYFWIPVCYIFIIYRLRYGNTFFAIVLTMNRGMDYWVSFSFTHPSLLHLKVKFMKKNWSCTIISTWRKQVPITYVSLGLLKQNKHFWTPLEQANKMMSRFLLLHCSFTKKETFKKFTEVFSTMCKYAPTVFNALYCKFKLVRLCPVFADPVTNILLK